MDFSEYQKEARKTAIYPEQFRIHYPAIAMSGEIGELNNKIGKIMRDGTPVEREFAIKEMGDILWFLSALASDMDISLQEVADRNIEKLRSRQQRGVLGGNGDDR